MTWQWSEAQPLHRPPAAHFRMLATDEARGRILMWGGVLLPHAEAGGMARGDERTWAWDGADWTVVGEGPGPAASIPANGSVASTPHGLIAFGGFGSSGHAAGLLRFMGGTGAVDETWRFGRHGWEQLRPRRHPTARMACALGYDPRRSTVLLFGGGDRLLRGRTDTWAWDGESWSELHPPTSPAPVLGGTLYFDEDLQQLVLAGGTVGRIEPCAQRWSWDGSTWREVTAPGGPRSMRGALAYHRGRRALVAVAGRNAAEPGTMSGRPPEERTWILEHGRWTAEMPTERPSARQNVSMAYDGARGELVLFGGLDVDRGRRTRALDDTWILRRGSGD